MKALDPGSLRAAFAQPLTQELILCSGITPGMRVLVAGADTGETALLVAERVGASGSVIGVDANRGRVACARQRARAQCFDQVTLVAGTLSDCAGKAPYDAVVGRFVLMREPNPVATIREAASLVRDGGRVVFVEWHLESVRWQHSSAWPAGSLYDQVARWMVDGLRLGGANVDMGLRLTNAFAEAGLPLPAVRTDVRALGGTDPHGFDVFAEMLDDALSVLEKLGAASARRTDLATLGARLCAESAASGGHAFLPLLVGAWTTIPPRS